MPHFPINLQHLQHHTAIPFAQISLFSPIFFRGLHSDLSFTTFLTLRIGAMATTRGTSLLRLLHQSAVAQAARYQPAGAQLSAPAFGTSPAQSILRRFFADGTQTIDRASVEAGDAAQKGKEFAQEKTEQAKDKANDVSETAKDKANDASETAKETASNVTDKVKETAAGAKEEGASTVEKVKEQASKEMNTAQDMTKDIPTKTKETAQDIKEVGIEAAKAVKRDASKLAEKVGLKTPSEESK